MGRHQRPVWVRDHMHPKSEEKIRRKRRKEEGDSKRRRESRTWRSQIWWGDRKDDWRTDKEEDRSHNHDGDRIIIYELVWTVRHPLGWRQVAMLQRLETRVIRYEDTQRRDRYTWSIEWIHGSNWSQWQSYCWRGEWLLTTCTWHEDTQRRV